MYPNYSERDNPNINLALHSLLAHSSTESKSNKANHAPLLKKQ
jgi:hypothetical protein